MDLAAMRARVRGAIKDLDAAAYYWTDDEVDAAIGWVLGEYTRVAPDVGCAARSGDGATRAFDCAAEPGYLYALAVEHPLDASPPAWLPFREHLPGTVAVLGSAPAAGGDNVRIWYARAHPAAVGGTWTVPAEDDGTVEVGAAAHLALAGGRYAAVRLNASQWTPGQLSEFGEARQAEFATRLDALRARPIGPQWRPVWGL